MADLSQHDLAHVGAVELFTPKFEESRWFFEELLAMRVVAEQGDSIYLSCWDEYELYTIKLTKSHTNGVGRTLFRAASPEALARRVAAIENAGLGHGWRDPEVGVTFTGTRKDVTIEDVLATLGPRRPATAAAARGFRQAFVFVAVGEPAAADITKIEQIRAAWEPFFARSTEGRGSVDARLR